MFKGTALFEYTTEHNPRREMNLLNESKKVCVDKLSINSRWIFLVTAHVISNINCLRSLSFTNTGPAKLHPITRNGPDCLTRSGGNGATVCSPAVEEKRLQIMQYLSRPFIVCLALSSQNLSCICTSVCETAE